MKIAIVSFICNKMNTRKKKSKHPNCMLPYVGFLWLSSGLVNNLINVIKKIFFFRWIWIMVWNILYSFVNMAANICVKYYSHKHTGSAHVFVCSNSLVIHIPKYCFNLKVRGSCDVQPFLNWLSYSEILQSYICAKANISHNNYSLEPNGLAFDIYEYQSWQII